MREQLQKYGKRATYVAGLVVVVEMVAVGFMWATANTSATDLGGGDVPIKIVQDSPPTPTPIGGCTAGDTGFLSPTSEAFDTGGDGDGFELNPTNAFADAGGNASNINGKDDRHRFYDYGISIPGACSIRGIEARLDWWLDSIAGTNSMDVELSWDGGTTWTVARSDTVETTTEHTGFVGAAVDRWGRTWSLSDSDNANFRLRLTSNATNNNKDFFLDWVPVKVHYGDPIQTTGLKSPSAEAFDTGGDGDGFELNPTNAFADGGGYAENIDGGTLAATECNSTDRDRHRYYDYGISIPAGSDIHGIEVRVDIWATNSTNSPGFCVELSWNGGTTWTTANKQTGLDPTEATFIVGGEVDGWGRTWSDTEFTNTNFRVRITNIAESVDQDFFLDWVAVEVHYSPP